MKRLCNLWITSAAAGFFATFLLVQQAASDDPAPEVGRVIEQLSDASFRKRLDAQQSLETLAATHLPDLLDIARTAPAETAQRIVVALELVFLKHADETGDKAERSLQSLAEQPGPVAGMARRVLTSNARLRESRARDAIARLGGEVIYYSPYSPYVTQNTLNAATSLVQYGDPGVIYIIWLYEDWNGGEEGLWHLSRFPDVPNLQIYTIPQNGLDPDRIRAMANRQLGAEVHVRGGCLGIRGIREIGGGGGCTIRSVVDRTAAQRAGLQEDDIIRRVNGQEISSFDDVVEILRPARPGDLIELEFDRPLTTTARSPFQLPPVPLEDAGPFEPIKRSVRLGSWREAHADPGIVRPPTVFRGPFGPPLGDDAPAPPPLPEPLRQEPEPAWILQ